MQNMDNRTKDNNIGTDNGSTLLLVDGHNLLFQMFFGMPSRIVGASGAPIQGIVGFVGALRKMAAMVHPTHVAVLFDSESPLARQQVDSAYKANRTDYSAVEEADNPFSQLDGIYRALDALGIAHCEVQDMETDDAIAAYAVSHAADRVVIASWDSDFFQLIDEAVQVLRYRGKSSCLIDRQTVSDKCGVPPEKYADWKALVGDSSDNIVGMPHIGPKTAAALLTTYGNVDGVLQAVVAGGGKNDKRLAHIDADRLRRNRQLIVLHGAEKLAIPMDDCRLNNLVDDWPPTMALIAMLGL